MKKERQIAIKILGEIEELLKEKEIKIPSDDRRGAKEEACIFGPEYYYLEDKITEILEEVIWNVI